MSDKNETTESGAKLYIRGIAMNMTNPKVAIFFLAFLPQFTDPSRGSTPQQIMILGLVFLVTAIIIFGAIVCAASYIGTWLKKSENAQKYINRIAGGIFALLACRLALSTNK